MLSLAFPLCIFLIGSVAFTSIFKLRFSISFPLFLMGSALLVYLVCFFTHSFNTGVIALCFFAAVLAVISILKLVAKRQSHAALHKPNAYPPPSAIALLVFIAADAVITWHHGACVQYWDEFAHWGQMVNEFLRLDDFYTAQGTFLQYHNDYPPIIPLYESIWCRLAGGYDERFVCFSLWLLQISLLLIPVDFAFGKKAENTAGAASTGKDGFARSALWGLLFAAAVLLFSLFFSAADGGAASFWYAFYPDTVLGLLGGTAIFLCLCREITYKEGLFIGATLAFLIMVKQSALFFVGITFLLFIARLTALLRQRKTTIKAAALTALLAIAPAILAYASWKMVLAASPIESVHGQFSISASDYLSLPGLFLGTAGTQAQQDVVWAFVNALLYEPVLSFMPISLSYTALSMILLILIGVCFIATKRKGYVWLFFTSLASIVLYAVFMLGMYPFGFTETEMSVLASYARYMATNLVALYAAMLMYSLGVLAASKRRCKAGTALVCGLAVLALLSPLCLKQFWHKPIDAAVSAKTDAAALTQLLPEGSSVFAVTQDEDTSRILLLEYYVTNLDIDRYSWAPVPAGETVIDPMYAAGETGYIDPDYLVELLQEDEYLYISNYAEGFNATYSNCLSFDTPIERGAVYRIETTDQGTIAGTLVGNVNQE